MLATVNTVDFLYTCAGHLTDSGFATILSANETRSTGVTEDEIAKVKEEWEEKQRKNLERKKKAKEMSQKDDPKKDDEKEASKSVPSSLSVSPSPAPTPTPTHERYALHRDYFAMRLAEHRKRKKAAQAKNLAPRLPGAPNGAVIEEKY